MKESWGQNLDLFMSLGLQSGPWLGLGIPKQLPFPGPHPGPADLSPKVHIRQAGGSGGSPPAGAGSRGAGAELAAGRAAPSSEGGLSWPLRAC